MLPFCHSRITGRHPHDIPFAPKSIPHLRNVVRTKVNWHNLYLALFRNMHTGPPYSTSPSSPISKIRVPRCLSLTLLSLSIAPRWRWKPANYSFWICLSDRGMFSGVNGDVMGVLCISFISTSTSNGPSLSSFFPRDFEWLLRFWC